MEILINIPDDYFNKIKQIKPSHYTARVYIAVQNGTPLPKGHGRLIDADGLEKRMIQRESELNDDKSLWESSAVSVALDMFAPTVIEADKENKNEETM